MLLGLLTPTVSQRRTVLRILLASKTECMVLQYKRVQTVIGRNATVQTQPLTRTWELSSTRRNTNNRLASRLRFGDSVVADKPRPKLPPSSCCLFSTTQGTLVPTSVNLQKRATPTPKILMCLFEHYVNELIYSVNYFFYTLENLHVSLTIYFLELYFTINERTNDRLKTVTNSSPAHHCAKRNSKPSLLKQN